MQENQVKIIDDFLPLDELIEIQNIIFDKDFSWKMPPPNSSCHGGDNHHDFMYFNHFFFEHHVQTSELYSQIIVPILNRLESAAPISVKSLVLFNKLFEKCDWHRDHPYDATTSILYLNSCNGGTELKINDEIQFVRAVENRMLIFPSQTDHRACSSTDVDLRFIINLNYFK